MRNILRIFDAWHESFALIIFCLSVAFFIVLTGFLRTGHWLLVLALSIVICAGGLACFWVLRWLAQLRRSEILAQTYENCNYGVVISGLDGMAPHVNLAAKEQSFSAKPGPMEQVLPKAWGDLAPTLKNLMHLAITKGWAQDVVTIGGQGLAIDLCRSAGRLVWSFRPVASRNLHAGLAQPAVPMVRMNGDRIVTDANAAFQVRFGDTPRWIDVLANGNRVLRNQVQKLKTLDGERSFHVLDHWPGDETEELYFFPVDDEQQVTTQSYWDLFEHLSVPLIKLSTKGVITSVNAAARSLFGKKINIGHDISEVFISNQQSLLAWISDVSEGKVWNKPIVLQLPNAKSGTIFQAALSRVFDGQEHVLIAAFSDVTALKSLERQFVQSHKMQAIGQLAGGVAHDFNNLLTAISGHCDLLLLRHDKNDNDFSDLMQIHQNANRAAALIGQLFAFSRKQNLQVKLLNIREIISDLAHLLDRLVGEKVNLLLYHGTNLPMVRADKRQLEQVLMNLVVNARDAMAEGGDVVIRTQSETFEKAQERESAVIPAGEYVKIQVEDFGAGISPEYRQKIFEPYFTTKRTGEGTGLGLSTVYGIVKQSNGFIFVDSEIGKGTVFEVLIPAVDRRTKQKEQKLITEVVSPPTQREQVVLLVEDEAPVRAFASRALRIKGLTVYEADCAEAALKILEDKTLKIDVFVTDVVMPGLDGPSWVRLALMDRPDTRVVFVSGYAEDAFEKQQSEIEGSVFLPKPFSLNDLTQAVLDVAVPVS